MNRATAIAIVLLFVLHLPAGAQDFELKPQDNQTVDEYIQGIKEFQDASQETKAANAKTTQTETAAAVAASTTSTAAAEGFSGRVNDTLADFLPLFQFAVDAVSTAEDKESVTVKFNPLSTGRGALAVQATIFQPEIFEPLLTEIVEPARPAQEEALEKLVGDFGDVGLSATWGLRRSARGVQWGDKVRLWGRHPKLYGRLVEDLAIGFLEPAFEETKTERGKAQSDLQNLLFDLDRQLNPAGTPATERVEVNGVKLSKLRDMMKEGGSLEGFNYGDLKAKLVAYGEAFRVLLQKLDQAPPLDGIAPLIDNQPQLTLSASWRERDELIGPNQFVATVRWELGSKNVNSVLREYRWLKADDPKRSHAQLIRDAFENITDGEGHRSQNKFSFSLTYKHQDDHQVTHEYVQTVTDPDTSTDMSIPRTASVQKDATDDVSGKFLWTRRIRRGALGSIGANGLLPENQPLPQLSFSIEYDHVDDDDPNRQSRLVGRLGYTLPLPSGMSLPVTLTYADRSEFLGEQDEVLSAHVGLSYKLNGGRP